MQGQLKRRHLKFSVTSWLKEMLRNGALPVHGIIGYDHQTNKCVLMGGE